MNHKDFRYFTMNHELWKVTFWLSSNKLSLKIKKQFLIYKLKEKENHVKHTAPVKIYDQQIEQDRS